MSLKKSVVLFATALLLVSCSSKPPKSLVTPLPPVAKQPLPATGKNSQPVRGVWLATVSRLDWPPVNSVNVSSADTRIRMQQKALVQKLDKLKSLGINTVFFQVKPDGTALWPSKILPWSDMLTGTIGQDPGYDPLQFVIDEAHKRGMKVHAWFNPYRVAVNTQPATIAALNRTLPLHPASVFVLHRDWIRTAGDRLVLDPGIPDVRDWITSIVAEVVAHYPVDGVQFDDYFYTETPGSQLNDNQTFQQYGQGFSAKADWRRNNTLLLIEQVSRTIKQLKPGVEFGVSLPGYGATALSMRRVPTRAARRLTMNPSPIPVAGCSRGCWIISPRKFTGPSRAALHGMTYWQNGGPTSSNPPIRACISVSRCIKWVNRRRWSRTGWSTAVYRS
ncbi:COG1649 predicted glycoside hydrolase [Kosakonia radicincitans]|nr:COG1649 predicted glycoside hydrolase [Kosakonia radicincitans]